MPSTITIDKDPAMTNPANLISGESVVLDSTTSNLFAVQYGCYFTESVVITKAGSPDPLRPNLDYTCLHTQADAVAESGREVCTVFRIDLMDFEGTYSVTYHAYGGEYSTNAAMIQIMLDNYGQQLQNIQWGMIVGKPNEFNPADHSHIVSDDVDYWNDLVDGLEQVRSAILAGGVESVEAIFQYMENSFAALRQDVSTMIANHANASSAHTKSAVGLSAVQNLGLATSATMSPTAAAGYLTNTQIPALMDYAFSQAGKAGAHTAGLTPASCSTLGVVSLNNIQAPGFYFQPANASAANGSNYPVNYAGALIVLASEGGGIVNQIYMTYSGGGRKVFTRGFYNGVWGGWEQLASTADVATAISAIVMPTWDTLAGKGRTLPVSSHDPNSPANGEMLMLTNHPNGPSGGLNTHYWYIMTTWYGASNNKGQFAIPYSPTLQEDDGVQFRCQYNGVWGAWIKLANATELAALSDKVDAHIADTGNYAPGKIPPHGATSTATSRRLIMRDINGRAQVAYPAVGGDIANKQYVDGTHVFGTNGYNRFPGGLVLQWGLTPGFNNLESRITTTVFPVPFPNACLNVTGNVKNSQDSIYIAHPESWVQIRGFTKNSFSWINQCSDYGWSAGGVYWQAIGY